VRIAIDYFGNGYAHHIDLKKLPLDFLHRRQEITRGV